MCDCATAPSYEAAAVVVSVSEKEPSSSCLHVQSRRARAIEEMSAIESIIVDWISGRPVALRAAADASTSILGMIHNEHERMVHPNFKVYIISIPTIISTVGPLFFCHTLGLHFCHRRHRFELDTNAGLLQNLSLRRLEASQSRDVHFYFSLCFDLGPFSCALA